MSTLITLENISLAFGLDVLLDKVKLQISTGERVCLIGRNGAGKSSLLKIIDGSLLPDSGFVRRHPQLRMARLEQELPQKSTQTVFEFVADGLANIGGLLAKYHALTHRLANDFQDEQLAELETLQHEMDAQNAWQYEQKIEAVLSHLSLNPDLKVAELSGGWQRRAALARALVVSPELLLLDEPTNHLDIEAIQWLEEELINSNIGLIFITHDRALLQRLATRIIELDRGELNSWPGSYTEFLEKKEAALHAEKRQNAEFDKKLAIEEKWVRQGIKARRTRNEGRVRALESMRRKRLERREIQGKVSFNVNLAERSGERVIQAIDITQKYNDKVVIDHFSIDIMRGDRIGLIGPNGVGKSTLLNILLGKISPQKGKVIQGTHLKIAYFDQLRMALDLEKSVAENVSHAADTIEINGVKKHIISYLGDFLFTPQRALTPVKALSGGECNRLLLARLFSEPSNLLVLDEPTNDLDMETLELLENLLCEYKGTLLIVSHDRLFLDNVVTSTIVFEGDGHLQEFIGGYQDWLRQRKPKKEIPSAPKITVEKAKPPLVATPKLTAEEQQELKKLPKQIEKLEAEQTALQMKMAEPDFYQQDPETIAKTIAELKKVTQDLEARYQRWESLESALDK